MRKKSFLILIVILLSVSFAYAKAPLVPDGIGGYTDPETGIHYSSDGIGGLVNSRDGTHLSPTGTGSGFINSKDGKFIPAIRYPKHDNNYNSTINDPD